MPRSPLSSYSAVRLAFLSLALTVHCHGFTVPSTPSTPSTSSARTTSTKTARQAHARRSHTITPTTNQKQDAPAAVTVTSKKSPASPRKKFQFKRKNTSEKVDPTAQTMFHAIDTDGTPLLPVFSLTGALSGAAAAASKSNCSEKYLPSRIS